MRSARGLTIAELVISSFLLALVLVTVMVLFGQMLDTTTKNSLLSQGSFFADTLLEQETARLLAQGPPRVRDGQDMIQFRDEGNQTEYLYRVSSETLPPVHYETTQGKAYLVQVEVRWWQSDGGTQPTRRGYGKLYVKRNRVVYAQAQP